MLTAVGKFIEERMAIVGIGSMKELSRRSGVSKSGLSRMRHAEQSIQRKTIERLAAALKCDTADIEILTPEPKQMPRKRLGIDPQFQKAKTICWGCQHAVPDPKRKRGCSWSEQLEPVKGWTAIETKNVRFDGGQRRVITSALVVECPKFIPDEKPGDRVEPEPPDIEVRRPHNWDGTIVFEDEKDKLSFEMARYRL